MRMNCTEAQAELPLFVGADLESAIHERVAAHLESCDVCRDLLIAASESRDVLVAGLSQTADLHGAFVATSSTPSVWPGLRDQLRSEGLISTSGGGLETVAVSAGSGGTAPAPRGRLLHWVSSSAAAAALLLFGALAGQLWNDSGSGPVMSDPIIPVVAIPANGAGAMSQGIPGALVELTPVVDSASVLKKLECVEDSFTRDAIYFTGMEIQSFSAFPGSGARAVSLRGSTIPAPLPDPTPSMDGLR